MRESRIKTVLAADRVAYGAWVQMANPESVEYAGRAGYDFVLIDREHGSFDLETTVHLLRAAAAFGVTPVVRVPDRNPTEIMRVLDAGAMGVLVPGVGTPEQASDAVRAARYAPSGNRGACPYTLATIPFEGSWGEFTHWSNRSISVWLLIEGIEGIGNIDRILEVPGIDAICLGPFDLSQALGLPGQTDHPAVVDKLKGIVIKARARGVEVVAVPFATTPQGIREEAQKWVSVGCRIVAGAVDRAVLRIGLAEACAAMRGTGPGA